MRDATPIKLDVRPEDGEPSLLDGIHKPPTRLAVTVSMYSMDRVFTFEGTMTTAQIRTRLATHLDELLVADMREVMQRDYHRRQEAEARGQ